MKPGDIIYCPDDKFGVHRFYRIEGVFLGGIGQQSLVELRSLTEKPGGADTSSPIETTFVPEPLLRGFTVFTPDINR